MFMFPHDVEGVSHAEGNAFEQGADHHCAGGAGGHRPIHPPRALGIGMRAAFAGEIRKEEKTFAAQRRGCGFAYQQLVRINLGFFS